MKVQQAAFLLAQLLITLLTNQTCASCVCEDPKALWCDEFSEDWNEQSAWSHDLGGGGWGNYESQIYNRENSPIVDGELRIHATKGLDENYYSSRIQTKGKVEFQYVRLEASIKVTNLEGGLWPAFWMLGANFRDIGWPFCGEIDIMELGSAEAIAKGQIHELVLAAMHWNATLEGDHVYEYSGNTTPGMVQDFHTYGLDWTPEKISMDVDGKELFSRDITSLGQFHKPFFVLFNLAVGGLFTGIAQPTTTGATEIVSIRRQVRYYLQ
ncbi:MAG: hypothetical protein SGBAC_001480 [Bacillariaceae sp.]